MKPPIWQKVTNAAYGVRVCVVCRADSDVNEDGNLNEEAVPGRLADAVSEASSFDCVSPR